MQPENMIPMFKGEDTSNTYLYYLDEGKIDEVLQLNSKQDVVITGERLKRGSHFGMVPFFTGYPSKERYRSQGFSKLLRIARNDLIEILKEYPVEY
jgi:CRP-like cAMP-binding protein